MTARITPPGKRAGWIYVKYASIQKAASGDFLHDESRIGFRGGIEVSERGVKHPVSLTFDFANAQCIRDQYRCQRQSDYPVVHPGFLYAGREHGSVVIGKHGRGVSFRHQAHRISPRHAFTISAEVIPPRNGSEQQKILHPSGCPRAGGAQFLAVTKGAGGSLRGGSLPIAQVIKEQFGVPAIAHFTCRDLTAHDVENQLIDHHYFGIRNILALRGDPPDGQATWKPREGGYEYAYQLIEQIRNLNAGRFLPRPGGPQADGAGENGLLHRSGSLSRASERGGAHPLLRAQGRGGRRVRDDRHVL